jgi:hypothetical protein
MASRRLMTVPVKQLGAGIVVRYSPDIIHYGQDQRLLAEQPLLPSRPYMESWLTDVPPDTLRWQVSTRPSVSKLKKSTQRSALQSYWYKSLCQALWEKGYNEKGQIAGTGGRGLVGTMEVTIFDGDGFGQPDEYLRTKCAAIVGEIERAAARPQKGLDIRISRPTSKNYVGRRAGKDYSASV